VGGLSNFVPDDLDHLNDWAIAYLVALKHDPGVLRALGERSDLPFPSPPGQTTGTTCESVVEATR
jgi:hypothetical protein